MIQLIPRSVTCPCQLLFTSTATLQCYSRVMLFPSHFATLRSAKKQQKQDFSLPSCWILQWVIRRGEEEGSLHVCKGGKLRASHQLLPVLAMKAHFPESLLMVVTSVTGWTLPASHRFRAVLYGLIASFPAGFTTARLMFSTCASRWTASEQSIVLSQQSRFMISWEGREGAMGNGREEHPFSYTLSAILRRSVFVSGFKIIFQTSRSSITHWPPPALAKTMQFNYWNGNCFIWIGKIRATSDVSTEWQSLPWKTEWVCIWWCMASEHRQSEFISILNRNSIEESTFSTILLSLY